MREYRIRIEEAGIKLHRYLEKLFPAAKKGLLYKQLRNKNITLNKKKASGNETLEAGAVIAVFFSDETIEAFSGKKPTDENGSEKAKIFLDEKNDSVSRAEGNVTVLYEDDDILAIDKPAGMLTQKAKMDDISLNEEMLSYLVKSGKYNFNDSVTKPSVCNRLDRNTSGIVLCGKTMRGLQRLSEILKDRSVKKYYSALVWGKTEVKSHIDAYITKDEKNNLSRVTDRAVTRESKKISTEFERVKILNIKLPSGEYEASLIKVHLLTGRSHQIRALMDSLGHPLLGDPKYGEVRLNKELKKKYGINRQLLHAKRVEFPDGLCIESELPGDFMIGDS